MERLPMTHESRLLAALLLAPLLLWAEFTHAHDIAAVKSAIEGTRQAVRSVDMRYSVKVTMFRGSLTAAARFDFPALEGDVPASEELLSYENQLLIDFATGRFAMDGSTDHFKVRLDEVGKVIVDSYTIYSPVRLMAREFICYVLKISLTREVCRPALNTLLSFWNSIRKTAVKCLMSCYLYTYGVVRYH
jgi:hypothetical protein